MIKSKGSMSALERQNYIRDLISDKRHTSVAELARNLNVSENTVRRDLDAISPITLFYTTPGKGGGIHAEDGWYSSSRYFTEGQEELLTRLSHTLQGDDAEMMKTILMAYSRPKHNER